MGVHFAQGFHPPGLVTGDAGRLFDEGAALFGSGVGDGADVALLDNGIGACAHAASHEEVVDVFQAAGLAVDEIRSLAAAIHAPGELDFGKVLELLRRGAVVIGDGQADFGHVQGRFAVGAGKDDVFHGLAPQLLDALLAHDPSQGIEDIALPAAVRPYDGRHPGGEMDGRLFMKRLKAGQVEFFQFHVQVLLDVEGVNGSRRGGIVRRILPQFADSGAGIS